jgi:hypothetical protein
MTASRLKDLYYWNNPAGHFFDHKSMRFFGDTMRNFGVRDYGSLRSMVGGKIVEVDVWDLYRKRPVAGGLHGHCAYFRKDNGQVIYSHK